MILAVKPPTSLSMTPEPRNEASLKVLIINDSIVERISLSRICITLGYQPFECGGLGDYMSIVEREKIDLVVCDEALTSLTGQEVCETLRAARLDFFVYFILISAFTGENDTLQALLAGTDDFVPKPINRNELQVRLVGAKRVIDLQKKLLTLQDEMPRTLRDLSRDLRSLSALQASQLPPRSKDYTGLKYDYLWIPKVFVSGDHLNVVPIDEQWLAFYVLDVVGHGVTAALRALELTRVLSLHPSDGVIVEQTRGAYVRNVRQPHEVLELLNQRYPMQGEAAAYFSLTYGLFNLHTGEISFSQAGSPLPFVQDQEGELTQTGDPSIPVGIVPNPEYKTRQLKLEPGMRFLVFTDGLTGIQDNLGNTLGAEGLQSLIAKGKASSLNKQLELIKSGLNHWASGKPTDQVFEDDATLLALQWKSIEESLAQDDEPATDERPELQRRRIDPSQFGFDDELAFDFARRKENSAVLLLTDHINESELPRWLLEWGYSVDVLIQFEHGIQHLSQNYKSFLVLDFDLLPRNLDEIVKRARSLSLNPSIYILIVSNNNPRTILLSALQAGADSFTQIECSPKELYIRLASGLRMAEAHRRVMNKNQALSGLRQEIEEDMKRIANMQSSHLPDESVQFDALRYATVFLPAGVVSRQYMNVFALSDGSIAFFHLTAEGKGLVGATRGLAVYKQLSSAAYDKHNMLSGPMSRTFRPSDVLRELNMMVLEDQSQDLQFSLCYGVIDPKSGEGRLSHGGYPLCALQPVNKEVVNLGAYGPPVGLNIEAQFNDVSFLLSPGDRIYVYSHSLNDHPVVKHSLNGNAVEWLGARRFGQLSELKVSLCEQLADRKEDVSMLCLQFGQYKPLAYKVYSSEEREALQQFFSGLFEENIAAPFMINLKVPVEPAMVAELSNEIELKLSPLNLSEEAIGRVNLALFEICTNICRYSGLSGDDFYSVDLMRDQEQLFVVISDSGAAPPDNLAEGASDYTFDFDETDPAEIPEGGMGLAMVAQLTTAFAFKRKEAINYCLMAFDVE